MTEADIIFDSEDEQFKKPFGAVVSGTMMEFHLLVSRKFNSSGACVRVKYDNHTEVAEYGMLSEETAAETDDYIDFSVRFPIYDRGLYWYSFEVYTPGGTVTVGKGADGRAVIVHEGEELISWQQTVYRRDHKVPEWLEGGVIYHIFVDRFFHSGPKVELEGKITRDDWGGMPNYKPDNGIVRNNDFFGGNLNGIREKLPYLKSLGVTCLYLSPIFEAYSNHKYDTSDYTKIDPMFGTEDDFRALCREAGDMGIKIILDGVFSHTGSDSIYFDKDHRYGGGAYGNPDSKYRSWYYFGQNERYETWWGIDTLPRINKHNESYREFICGKDGIARKWLREGASGWRLDVADELPNDFLVSFVNAVKDEKEDAAVIGEVWEDGSNKIAYDERKNYFQGDKLDSVMNYPLMNAIISFVRNGDAPGIGRTMDTILENYPRDVVNCLMNILGTHDTMRIMTALAGRDLGYDPSRDEQASVRMTPDEWEKGVRMLKIASVLQMTLPGVPCIYYGDEAGMEGYKDPFNRQCYPWGHENRELQEWYRKIIAFRRARPVYRDGEYRTVAAIDGLYAFERFRRDEKGRATESVITAANCGEKEEVI
ncbi:MAG: glycoside hydrolase family 13 protein, partial [Anaerovoracaceae bacterium]